MERAELRFEAPGEGLWTNDRVHFFRPQTAIGGLVRPGAFEGNALSAERYGPLIDRPDLVMLNRFAYTRARPLVPRPPGTDRSARDEWLRAAKSHPVASRRLEAAERVFKDRIWRRDLEEWDERRKPAAMARTRQLTAVDVSSLDDSGLSAHARDCVDHLLTTISLHHEFNGTWQVPLGDYLAHTSEWTGLPPSALAATLEGASPASAGVVPELADLAIALRTSSKAREVLSDGMAPAEALHALEHDDGAVGAAARNYIHTVGYRNLAGFDPMDEYALEHPASIVQAIRAAVDSEPTPPDGSEAIDQVREAVPSAHRDEFNALLAETRATFRVKDERGLFANTPVNGLVRRAFLEGGRRLADSGRLAQREHAVEASLDEIELLLSGEAGEHLAGELADRYAFRSTYTSNDAPQSLGSPHEEPPPIEWLPPAAARVARAGTATQATILAFVAEPSTTEELIVSGAGVSSGSYTGPARLVLNPGDIKRVEAGDVLVAIATNPGYTSVMHICGAIVTDAGGPLSHAAIVARELGVPAVVGTGSATTTIADGAMITVDGAAGEVRSAD